MENSAIKEKKNFIIENAVDITLKIGALLLLLTWCFQILRPFFNILLWAMIIAISLFPLYNCQSLFSSHHYLFRSFL